METISQSPSTPSDKPRTISERLAAVAKTSFIGRQKELSLLVQAAIGNTSPKVNRYVMDCREIEPTPQGFQIALGEALEVPESEPDFATVVNCLAEQNQRSVLAPE